VKDKKKKKKSVKEKEKYIKRKEKKEDARGRTAQDFYNL
jgi:hypothetical protein